MYHSTNTLHPKKSSDKFWKSLFLTKKEIKQRKEQRNTALALIFTLLSLVVVGYLMIYILVLNHNAIINLHNYCR